MKYITRRIFLYDWIAFRRRYRIWERGPEHVLRNVEDLMTQDSTTEYHLQVYESISISQCSRIHETGKYKCGAKLALKKYQSVVDRIYRKISLVHNTLLQAPLSYMNP